MSIWKEEYVSERIVESLKNLNATGDNFVTAYQLAIQFGKDHGEIIEKLDFPLGREGSKQNKILASYLTGEIAKHKKMADMDEVDMKFLLTTGIQDINFEYDKGDSFYSSIREGYINGKGDLSNIGKGVW
ncbi:hypothetical protein [Xylanivirga thermophila]|uniref:hypothetical protein n=1 Tax=Xylanivirga thermophila TaxID=2496273 RepID=UPI0039F4B4AD